MSEQSVERWRSRGEVKREEGEEEEEEEEEEEDFTIFKLRQNPNSQKMFARLFLLLALFAAAASARRTPAAPAPSAGPAAFWSIETSAAEVLAEAAMAAPEPRPTKAIASTAAAPAPSKRGRLPRESFAAEDELDAVDVELDAIAVAANAFAQIAAGAQEIEAMMDDESAAIPTFLEIHDDADATPGAAAAVPSEVSVAPRDLVGDDAIFAVASSAAAAAAPMQPPPQSSEEFTADLEAALEAAAMSGTPLVVVDEASPAEAVPVAGEERERGREREGEGKVVQLRGARVDILETAAPVVVGRNPATSLNPTSLNPTFLNNNTNREPKQPCLGVFNTESSQEDEARAEAGGGIGDLVAALLLGGASASSPSSSSSPSTLSSPAPCPPSAPLRDSSGACVETPPQACSSAQPHCASCDPSWRGPEGFASCLGCEAGFFAFSSAFVLGGESDGGFGASTAGARSCLECSSLRCARGKCGDGRGCTACPEGLRLVRRSESAPLSCVEK